MHISTTHSVISQILKYLNQLFLKTRLPLKGDGFCVGHRTSLPGYGVEDMEAVLSIVLMVTEMF